MSLLHPAMMGSLLLFSLYTAFLGFQWRRQRTLGDDISALRKTLPDLEGATSVKEAIATADGSRLSVLQSALEVEAQVTALTQERKDLAAAAPRDKHFSQGALLVFAGTLFAIEVSTCVRSFARSLIRLCSYLGTNEILEGLTHCVLRIGMQGPLNTYARAGKLFPGPHLYAGAGLVVLWALAASCVPAMQKGNDTARSIHIGANVAGIGLFGWQVVSGIPILQKVWELTKWP